VRTQTDPQVVFSSKAEGEGLSPCSTAEAAFVQTQTKFDREIRGKEEHASRLQTGHSCMALPAASIENMIQDTGEPIPAESILDN